MEGLASELEGEAQDLRNIGEGWRKSLLGVLERAAATLRDLSRKLEEAKQDMTLAVEEAEHWRDGAHKALAALEEQLVRAEGWKKAWKEKHDALEEARRERDRIAEDYGRLAQMYAALKEEMEPPPTPERAP